MKAFPTPTFSINDEARVTAVGGEGGMDLRDYFAAMAMQVLMAETDGEGDDNPGAPRFESDQVAELAYDQADAMLRWRNK